VTDRKYAEGRDKKLPPSFTRVLADMGKKMRFFFSMSRGLPFEMNPRWEREKNLHGVCAWPSRDGQADH